jgi:hypothetical protein
VLFLSALRKYNVPENITIIKAGDFAKLKAKASL